MVDNNNFFASDCIRAPPKTREVLGNLDGEGDQFPNNISCVLLEYGHSLVINLSSGRGSENPSLCTGKN